MESGMLVPVPSRAGTSPVTVVSDITLRSTTSALLQGAARREVRPLWLAASLDEKALPVLIAADSESAELTRVGDGVLYRQSGAAWFVPLVRLNRGEFEAAREGALRARAMSDAKQIALSLTQLASDQNGEFPSTGDIGNTLRSRLPDAGMTERLVYTFSGGQIDSAARASTVLGYVPGPGGRANIHADGHVAWVPAG
jgi:hypothetical protein